MLQRIEAHLGQMDRVRMSANAEDAAHCVGWWVVGWTRLSNRGLGHDARNRFEVVVVEVGERCGQMRVVGGDGERFGFRHFADDGGRNAEPLRDVEHVLWLGGRDDDAPLGLSEQ